MNSRKLQILIVGGYGEVGQLVARFLYDLGHHQLIIAGRSLKAAQALSQSLPGSSPRQLDAFKSTWSDADFEGIGLVVNCIDSTDDIFARACLSRGLSYFDLTADDRAHQRIEALQSLALENHGTAVLSLGLAPGLTNLLARQCHEQRPDSDKFEVGVMLGLGDLHGKAAIRWTLENLFVGHSNKQIFNFGRPWDQRASYWFNFSDQYALERTYHKNFATYLSLSSALVTSFIGFLRKWPRLKGLLSFITEDLIYSISQKFKLPDDGYAVVVRGVKENRSVVEYRISGRIEKVITAKMAALAVHLYLEKQNVSYGVFHSHQIFLLKEFESLFTSDIRLSQEL